MSELPVPARRAVDVEGPEGLSFSLPFPPFEVEGEDFSRASSWRFLLSAGSRNKGVSDLPLPLPSVARDKIRSLYMSSRFTTCLLEELLLLWDSTLDLLHTL